MSLTRSTVLLGWSCPQAKQLGCGKPQRGATWRGKRRRLKREIRSGAVSEGWPGASARKPLSGPQFPQLFPVCERWQSVQKPLDHEAEEGSCETTEKGRSAHKAWLEAAGQGDKQQSHMWPRLFKELLVSSQHGKNFPGDTRPTREAKLL